MKLLFDKLRHFLLKLESKIAFYPTLLGIGGFLLSLAVLYLEGLGASAFLREELPSLIIKDPSTARTLISTFIAGIISLMVFSFSMVMILLNQASNNFSPRLLPGLISNRRHQLVLGFYLATLVYSIFTLIAIESTVETMTLPAFSVLIAVILTISCLGIFIYFIHSISQAIQVNNILQNIHDKSQARLLEIIEDTNPKASAFPEGGNWFTYYANETGYFQDLLLSTLLNLGEEQEMKIEILPVKGSFILKGIPLFKCTKQLEEEEIRKVLGCFIYSRTELLEENYVLGFKQITEIALKAMSPGINDPGTALNAIDYLTELFAIRMRKSDTSLISREDTIYIKLNTVKFSDLLYLVMASLRKYCKHDVIIVQKLFIMLKYLHYQHAQSDDYKKCIENEVRTLMEDVEEVTTNSKDLESIKQIANEFDINSY